jgi:hypothetical protein
VCLQIGDSGCLRHVDEGAVAIVAVKAVLAIPETDEDVEVPVPVEVSDRDRLGARGGKQLRLDGLERWHLTSQGGTRQKHEQRTEARDEQRCHLALLAQRAVVR